MFASYFTVYLDTDGVEFYCFKNKPFSASYEKLDLLLTCPILLLEELDRS